MNDISQLNIAVISDLHIGDSARAKELCPTGNNGAAEDEFRRKFMEFSQIQNVPADYLIIPGDISDRAKPDEFLLASEIITEVAATLQVPIEKILFVPGNHDVDWTRADGLQTC